MQVEALEGGHHGSHKFVSFVVLPSIFTPSKAVQIEQTVCISIYYIFNHEAIRRRMYQLYEAKDVWLSRAAGNETSCQGCQTMKYCAIYNTGHFTRRFPFSGERTSLRRLLKDPVLSNPMQLKAFSPNPESYNGAWNFGFCVYLLSVVILVCCCFASCFC